MFDDIQFYLCAKPLSQSGSHGEMLEIVNSRAFPFSSEELVKRRTIDSWLWIVCVRVDGLWY